MATPSHTPPRHALIKAHQAFDGENMVGSCVTEVVDGIICDGHQVDAANLKTAFRAKGRNRLMLVTDAMATVG